MNAFVVVAYNFKMYLLKTEFAQGIIIYLIIYICMPRVRVKKTYKHSCGFKKGLHARETLYISAILIGWVGY